MNRQVAKECILFLGVVAVIESSLAGVMAVGGVMVADRHSLSYLAKALLVSHDSRASTVPSHILPISLLTRYSIQL
ncbi:MAG: hypothetical protein HY961_18960 [Ignavibacteriae bacterium]|nr:hypothetical protein [Ignavibacteriota bacterium]